MHSPDPSLFQAAEALLESIARPKLDQALPTLLKALQALSRFQQSQIDQLHGEIASLRREVNGLKASRQNT
jgi:polyhydroxyalkanoate synthesis regulator phasin